MRPNRHDGINIMIFFVTFSAAEMMFQPALFEIPNAPVGIVTFARDVIMTCDPAVQPLLWKHVILSGGNTMFAGWLKFISLCPY